MEKEELEELVQEFLTFNELVSKVRKRGQQLNFCPADDLTTVIMRDYYMLVSTAGSENYGVHPYGAGSSVYFVVDKE